MASEKDYRKKIKEAYDEGGRSSKSRGVRTGTYIKAFAVIILIIAIVLIFSRMQPRTGLDLSEQAQLKTFTNEADLKQFFNTSREAYGYSTMSATTMATAGQGLAAESGAAPAAKAAADDYSTTNIQVEGVDEGDFVKNDGKYIYAVSGEFINIVDAFPAENARVVSTINLSGIQELYVNGDRLVVIGNNYNYYYGPMPLKAEKEVVQEPMSSPTWEYRPPTAYIRVYDISDRADPILKKDIVLNGTYSNSRMIGDYVYTIITTQPYYVGSEIVVPRFSPEQTSFQDVYYFDVPDSSYQFTNILSLNVMDDSMDVQNKVFLLGYSTNLFVSEKNIYLVYQKRVPYTYMIYRALDEILLPVMPSDLVARISEIRNSDRSEYDKLNEMNKITNEWRERMTPEEAAQLERQFQEKYYQLAAEIAKEMDKSVVHKISIDNGKIEYKTKGEVPGHPLNQFSMDEYNGYFRIATTTTSFSGGGFVATSTMAGSGIAAQATSQEQIAQVAEPVTAKVTAEAELQQEMPTEEPVQTVEPITEPTPVRPVPTQPATLNHLYVLDEGMNIVGKLEDLAKGESIYSARFIGNRAYLVTFVRIDPLFVIDLSDPANPKVLGELKIPGVSDYLHPYDENHIIGVGKSTGEVEPAGWARFKGIKLSLFDVSDVSNPKEVAKYEIGERGTDSEALRDHKAFLFSKSKNLLVIPVMLVEKTDEQSYWQPNWQGAYVFSLTLQDGFTLKGRITHADAAASEERYYYYGPYSVTRSLYMDDVLYTISGTLVKANNLNDMSEISKVNLVGYKEYGYYKGFIG
jgi:uncharacterized secreted protein with C-terminal beta-propeller domain